MMEPTPADAYYLYWFFLLIIAGLVIATVLARPARIWYPVNKPEGVLNPVYSCSYDK